MAKEGRHGFADERWEGRCLNDSYQALVNYYRGRIRYGGRFYFNAYSWYLKVSAVSILYRVEDNWLYLLCDE